MTEENTIRVVIESPVHGPAVLAELARLQGQEAAQLLHNLTIEAAFAVQADTINTLAISVAHERAAHMDALHEAAIAWDAWRAMSDRAWEANERSLRRSFSFKDTLDALHDHALTMDRTRTRFGGAVE